MNQVTWTEAKPYTVTIMDKSGQHHDRGPFDYKAAASYAAKVISEELKEQHQPSIEIWCKSAVAVEVLGGSTTGDSPHYRTRYADGDLIAAVGQELANEWRYIAKATSNAGANGYAP